MGKLSRNPFESVDHAARTGGTKPLKLIHSDVMGLTASFGGKKYAIFFTDDPTRFIKVYFIKVKEKQLDRSIKRIRVDGGGEYSSAEFIAYLANNGIIRETTAPYSLQQNRVSERYSRMLARSMLKEKTSRRPSVRQLQLKESITLHGALCAGLGDRSTPTHKRKEGEQDKGRRKQFSLRPSGLSHPPLLSTPTLSTHASSRRKRNPHPSHRPSSFPPRTTLKNGQTAFPTWDWLTTPDTTKDTAHEPTRKKSPALQVSCNYNRVSGMGSLYTKSVDKKKTTQIICPPPNGRPSPTNYISPFLPGLLRAVIRGS